MINKLFCFLSSLVLFVSAVAMAEGSPPALVRVAPAINMETAPYVWVSGTIIERLDSRIAAEAEGKLIEILDVGERVREGDVIARINDASHRLALNEAQAKVLPVEAKLAFYVREVVRLEKLTSQNNAAKNQLDEVRANRDEAIANIEMIKTRIAIVRDELNKTTIQAPFDGIITERLKMPGERAGVGDQVVRLVNTDSLEIQSRIQQASFPFIKKNNKLTVRDGSDEITAQVRTVIPVADDRSRLYEIRVEFDKLDWLAGKAVELAVPIREAQVVIAVPRDALVIRQSGIVVYKIDENKAAQLIPVKTGISNTTHIQVIGEVKAGDNIVIRGNERLRPGQLVQIIDNSDVP